MALNVVSHKEFDNYMTKTYAGNYFSRLMTDYICIAETDANSLVVMDYKTLAKIVNLGGKVTSTGFEVSNYEDTVMLASTKDYYSSEKFISFKDMYHFLRQVDKTELLMVYSITKNKPLNIVNVSIENGKINIKCSPEKAVEDIDNLRQLRTATFNVRFRQYKDKVGELAYVDKDVVRTQKAAAIVQERGAIFEQEHKEARERLKKAVSDKLKSIPMGLDHRHKKLIMTYVGKDVKAAEPNSYAVHTLILHKKANGQIKELKYVLARLDLENIKDPKELKRVINGRESVEAMILNGEKIVNVQLMGGRNTRGKDLAGKRQYSEHSDGDKKTTTSNKNYSVLNDDKLIDIVYV